MQFCGPYILLAMHATIGTYSLRVLQTALATDPFDCLEDTVLRRGAVLCSVDFINITGVYRSGGSTHRAVGTGWPRRTMRFAPAIVAMSVPQLLFSALAIYNLSNLRRPWLPLSRVSHLMHLSETHVSLYFRARVF
jgi:hypothetical protein